MTAVKPNPYADYFTEREIKTLIALKKAKHIWISKLDRSLYFSDSREDRNANFIIGFKNEEQRQKFVDVLNLKLDE